MNNRILTAVGLLGVVTLLAGCSTVAPHAINPPITPRPVLTTTTSTTTSTLPTTTTTTTLPPTTTTTIDPVCEQITAIDGCPLGTPAAIAWAQQQDQAAQAAASQQAMQAYEQCLGNDAQADAAAIQQTFSGQSPPAGTPAWEPCSTAGLTPAEIQQAQQYPLG
jgi:hypothetical protein